VIPVDEPRGKDAGRHVTFKRLQMTARVGRVSDPPAGVTPQEQQAAEQHPGLEGPAEPPRTENRQGREDAAQRGRREHDVARLEATASPHPERQVERLQRVQEGQEPQGSAPIRGSTSRDCAEHRHPECREAECDEAEKGQKSLAAVPKLSVKNLVLRARIPNGFRSDP
jgi:hypothetical protein